MKGVRRLVRSGSVWVEEMFRSKIIENEKEEMFRSKIIKNEKEDMEDNETDTSTRSQNYVE
jgi:hypothetical protein